MSAIFNRLGSAWDSHVRLPELEADQHVEKRDEAHRQHEKEERGQFERVIDNDSLDRAHDHVGVVAMLDHAKLQRLGQRARYSHQPYREDQLDHARQIRQSLREKRMADRHVSFDGEGGDGEYGCVHRRLRGEAAQYAEILPEDVRVFAPDHVHLRWQTRHE